MPLFKVVVNGGLPGFSIDIREQPGNPSTTLVKGGKPLRENQEVSLVVENEDLEGTKATIVVLDAKGNLVGITIEHAKERADISNFVYQITAPAPA